MPTPHPAESVPLPRWKKVLFLVAGILIVAAVLETGAGLFLRLTSGYDGEHLYQFRFDPYKNIHPTPGYVDTRGIRHNEQGFREDEAVSRSKPPGTYRIFLMGASTAYGTGSLWTHLQSEFEALDNSETISAYLEEHLAASMLDRKIEVINAAIPSVWTHHHLIYLNQEILSYEPDMVIFLDGFNDFYFWRYDHEQFADYAYGEQSRVIMGPPTIHSLATMNGWWLFRKSAFFHVLGRAARTAKLLLTPEPRQDPIPLDRALRQLPDVFSDNALAMIERTALILRNEDVEGVFMLQPLLLLERERYEARMPMKEKALFEFNVESRLPGYEEFMRRATPILAEMERERVEALDGQFVDLTSIYRGFEGQAFTDYAHLTPRANQVLADTVARRILPTITRQVEDELTDVKLPSPTSDLRE